MTQWAEQPQRLPPTVTDAIADGTGAARFVFQAIPSQRERWGVWICPAAPAGSEFLLVLASAPNNAGNEVGYWVGPNTWGPMVVPGMLTAVVEATGLVAGADYALAWWGYEGPTGSAESQGWIYPAPSAQAPLVAP